MNTGAWIGIIAGLVGVVVAIAVVLMVAGTIGLYISGGILILFGGMAFLFYKLFFQQMILASRLEKTGVPGKGIIKEVIDTNVTINYNPQVKLVIEVKNSFGQTYIASVRTVVSRLQPFIYQPGMTVRLLIDPNDETKMILDTKNASANSTDFSFDNINVSALQTEMLTTQREGETILITGKPARAIIKKYTWLGIYLNGNNPYAELQIEVLPDNEPAFEAKVKTAIAAQSVSKYQPGQEIQVKYDMLDKSKVAVVHL